MYQSDTPPRQPNTNTQPKVAVIVPVYNVASYLRECLDSILTQTYTSFTVFAVDDGSTDESGAILDEYAVKDLRLIVIHQKNGGISAARNAALDRIERDGTFQYVAFVDSDDKVLPDFLATSSKTLFELKLTLLFAGSSNSTTKDGRKQKVLSSVRKPSTEMNSSSLFSLSCDGKMLVVQAGWFGRNY